MRYIKVEWPEIQNYSENPDYQNECYYDPAKDVYFIPEDWSDDPYAGMSNEELREIFEDLWFGGDIGDLDDALG